MHPQKKGREVMEDDQLRKREPKAVRGNKKKSKSTRGWGVNWTKRWGGGGHKPL